MRSALFRTLALLVAFFSLPYSYAEDLAGPFAKDIKYLAIHHTEVRASECGSQFEAVNEYHRRKWGNQSFLRKWGGYNAFIDVDGTLTWYRLYGEKSAAQLAHNFDTLSICMAGNFNVDMPEACQIKSLVKFLYAHPGLTIVFHRDLADRTCPGTKLDKQWLKKVLEEGRPPGAAALNVHLGRPNLSADDSVLREREHAEAREKYKEICLSKNDSEVYKFERAKLKSIVEGLDGRIVKNKSNKKVKRKRRRH